MSVEITHSLAEGTIVHGTERGDGSAEILKRHRYRWSRNLGAWYVPQSRDRIADRYRIEKAAEALREAGFAVAVEIDNATQSAAERESRKAERAEERHDGLMIKAERKAAEGDSHYRRSNDLLAPIPFGQPILVGHHSERGHRATLKRAHQAMDRASEAWSESKDAEHRADAAIRSQRHRMSPDYIGNRIAEREAEERRLQRILDGTQGYPFKPAEGTYREDTLARLAQAGEDLAYFRGQLAELEASGRKLWSKDDFKPGDYVKLRGRWEKVVRANAKTLSVDSGYSWTIKYRYTEVQDRRSAEKVSA